MKRMRPSATTGMRSRQRRRKASAVATTRSLRAASRSPRRTRPGAAAIPANDLQHPVRRSALARLTTSYLSTATASRRLIEMAEYPRLGVVQFDELATPRGRTPGEGRLSSASCMTASANVRGSSGRHAQERHRSAAVAATARCRASAVATKGRPTAMMLKTFDGTAKAAASGRCGTRWMSPAASAVPSASFGCRSTRRMLERPSRCDFGGQIRGLAAVAAQHDLDVQPPVASSPAKFDDLAEALLAAEIAAVQHSDAGSRGCRRGRM